MTYVDTPKNINCYPEIGRPVRQRLKYCSSSSQYAYVEMLLHCSCIAASQTCNAICTLLKNRNVLDALHGDKYKERHKFPLIYSICDKLEAFQKFVLDHRGMDAKL
jgi:hypothetical protein